MTDGKVGQQMMTCREIAQLVTDYLEGRMTTFERMRFRLHLSLCPPCKVHLDKMQDLVTALGKFPAEQHIPQELIEHFRVWKRAPDAVPAPPGADEDIELANKRPG